MKRTTRSARLRCAAFALSFIAVSASADNYCNVNQITDDLHKSCTEFSISSDGVFKATCIINRLRSGRTRTIDLDGHIGNDLYSDNFNWSGSDFSSKCNTLTVTAETNGVTLKGHCDRNERALAMRGQSPWKVWKEVNLNDGIKTDCSDQGNLKKR